MSQMQQANHFPWKIYRDARGTPRWWQVWYEVWLVLSGRYRFWQAFHDGAHRGRMDEYTRIVVNGGDLGPVIDAAIYATCAKNLDGQEPQHTAMSGYRRAAWERYERDRAAILNHLGHGALGGGHVYPIGIDSNRSINRDKARMGL